MSTKLATALGYLFDALSFVLLGLGLYLFLEDPYAVVPGVESIIISFSIVFLLRVLMRYPQLYAFPGVWRIDGEAKRVVAPYSVSFIKAIAVLVSLLPIYAYSLVHFRYPMHPNLLFMIFTLAWVFGSMALFMLPAVRLAARWRQEQKEAAQTAS